MSVDNRDLQFWRAQVQEYLDDILPRKDAVRFFLQTQKHPELKAELEAYRRICSALDAVPRATPVPDFDARVLSAVPLERYRTAPRHPDRVLVIGDASSALVQRLIRPLRRGMTAVAAAYVLFLAVSHSFLARSAAELAGRVGGSLEALAARTQQVPLLSSVVNALVRVYDASVHGLASLGGVLGFGVLTVVVGVLVGVTVLVVYQAARRHSTDRRTQV